MEKEKVLQIRDLRISFRTNEGVVKAVRGVSYDLYKGETLAIVGESGSGKSVSSRAIMGILAGNSIIDGGQIVYQGQNLLKLREDQFHKIRGNKIGMIFQDPTSSLNPIMRVGQQISEGMLINGKRKKNKFHALYQKEEQDYINVKYEIKEVKTNYNFSIKKKKNLARYRLEIKQIKANFSLSKEEKQIYINDNLEIIKQIKASTPILSKQERKAKLHELKVQLKETRSAYKASKKQARISIKEEYKAYKEEYLNSRNEVVSTAKVRAYKSTSFLAFFAFLLFTVLWIYCSNQNYSWANFLGIGAALGFVSLICSLVFVRRLTKQYNDISENYQRKIKVTKKEAYEESLKIMREVGIPEPEKRINMYPFQFSGGMKQRIVIAIALTATPEILICDEPTTALDVTIQAQILELLKKIKKERDLSLIFITHNLGVVANVADRVAVMYAGKIVEYGLADDIFYHPAHPYTWALLSSMPDLNSQDKLLTIPGTPPNMLYPPKGDAFAQRNKYAMKIDFEQEPPLFEINEHHYAATWLLHKDAPKVEAPKIIFDRIEYMKKEVERMKKKLASESSATKETNIKAEKEVAKKPAKKEVHISSSINTRILDKYAKKEEE